MHGVSSQRSSGPPKLWLGTLGLSLSTVLIGVPPLVLIVVVALLILGEIALELIRWRGARDLERERWRAEVIRAEREQSRQKSFLKDGWSANKPSDIPNCSGRELCTAHEVEHAVLPLDE